MSFSSVKSFAKAKEFVYEKRKENASIWFAESLESLFRRKKLSYLTHLRGRALNKRKVETLKKYVVGQNLDKTMRKLFLRWREQSNKKSLALELYDEGPVRHQEIGLKADLKNIKSYMKQEGYDDQDTATALNEQLGR